MRISGEQHRGAAALQKCRLKAKDGRIERLVSRGGQCPPKMQSAVLGNFLGILGRKYLTRELASFKRMTNALNKYKDQAGVAELITSLSADPLQRSLDCVLCPVWKHERTMRIEATLASRYVFEEVREECCFITVIFDFAANLDQLEQCVIDSERSMNKLIARMTQAKTGIVVAGAFEPDLRSAEDFSNKRDLARLASDLKWSVPDAGGWVLSGHFFVRAPRQDTLKKCLAEIFGNSVRVEIKRLFEHKGIEESLSDILNYATKANHFLLGAPQHTREKGLSDKTVSSLSAAFFGPELHEGSVDPSSFDVNQAIVQWALFIHRLGPKKLFFCKESGRARKWLSKAELEDHFKIQAMHPLNVPNREPQRGHLGLDGARKLDHIKSYWFKRTRTRQLSYDHFWIERTTPPSRLKLLRSFAPLCKPSIPASYKGSFSVFDTPTICEAEIVSLVGSMPEMPMWPEGCKNRMNARGLLQSCHRNGMGGSC